MKKIVLAIITVSVISIAIYFNSNSIAENGNEILPTDTISAAEESINDVTSVITNTFFSETIISSEIQEPVKDIKTTDEYIFLSESGILKLVNDDLIWQQFICSDFSFQEGYSPVTIVIDDRTYYELAITARNNSERIEEVFQRELAHQADSPHYECPFDSIEDMKQVALNYYTEAKFDTIISRSDLIEEADSLFLANASGVSISSDDYISIIEIFEKTSDSISFKITFANDCNEITPTKTYHVIKSEDKWLIDE